MKKITSQQQRVLDCIQIYLNKTGFPPTRADICKELGFKSPNSAETHLRALEKKGFISIESGTSSREEVRPEKRGTLTVSMLEQADSVPTH